MCFTTGAEGDGGGLTDYVDAFAALINTCRRLRGAMASNAPPISFPPPQRRDQIMSGASSTLKALHASTVPLQPRGGQTRQSDCSCFHFSLPFSIRKPTCPPARLSISVRLNNEHLPAVAVAAAFVLKLGADGNRKMKWPPCRRDVKLPAKNKTCGTCSRIPLRPI